MISPEKSRPGVTPCGFLIRLPVPARFRRMRKGSRNTVNEWLTADRLSQCLQVLSACRRLQKHTPRSLTRQVRDAVFASARATIFFPAGETGFFLEAIRDE